MPKSYQINEILFEGIINRFSKEELDQYNLVKQIILDDPLNAKKRKCCRKLSDGILKSRDIGNIHFLYRKYFEVWYLVDTNKKIIDILGIEKIKE